MQTMQESTNYINTLQRSQCVSEDNGDCTAVRVRRDATHGSEQHVPSQDDVLCSVSSSFSSSHNVEPVTFDNHTNPLLNNSTLYDNSSATNIVAEHPDRKDGYLFQTYDVASAIDPDIRQRSGANALDQQVLNTLEATVPYHNVSPVSPVSAPTPPPHTNQEHPRPDDAAHCQFLRAILEIVSRAVKCAACQCTFNASVLCSNYTIKLNRPIQCACGCVICSMCYTKDQGCLTHKVNSRRATVNVTANQLANAADVKWDLELDKTAVFRAECDYGMQSILRLDRGGPTADELKQGKSGIRRIINIYNTVITMCVTIFANIVSFSFSMANRQPRRDSFQILGRHAYAGAHGIQICVYFPHSRLLGSHHPGSPTG